MMAEMGSAYRREEGVDLFLDEPQRRAAFAFIGTFMWFSSVHVDGGHRGQGLGAVLNFLLGADKTQVWALGG